MKPFTDVFPAGAVSHHFVGQDEQRGVYAKELHIPAGFSLISHRHNYDHLAILASGRVMWRAGDEQPALLEGPLAVTVDAHIAHELRALTDVVWFCVHPTDETDAANVDAVILKETAE